MKNEFQIGDLVIGHDENGAILGRIDAIRGYSIAGVFYLLNRETVVKISGPHPAWVFNGEKLTKVNNIVNTIADLICKDLE